MEDVYNVSWKNFPDHLKLLFLELYRTESHADVTLLSTDEVEFKAHKVVLSSCSPVLKKLESILLLLLMYVGEEKLNGQRREHFYRVAKELGVKNILDITYSIRSMGLFWLHVCQIQRYRVWFRKHIKEAVIWLNYWH